MCFPGQIYLAPRELGETVFEKMALQPSCEMGFDCSKQQCGGLDTERPSTHITITETHTPIHTDLSVLWVSIPLCHQGILSKALRLMEENPRLLHVWVRKMKLVRFSSEELSNTWLTSGFEMCYFKSDIYLLTYEQMQNTSLPTPNILWFILKFII